MSGRVGIREVRTMLQDRVPALVRELLPDGRREGPYWVAKNPTRADSRAGSFKIWLRGGAPGAWRDYATPDKGDVVDLIAYLHGSDRAAALSWAKDWLGIRHMSEVDRERMKMRVAREAASASRREEERARWKRERAAEIFAGAERIAKGSPAELYFIARQCPLASVAHPTKLSLRFRYAMEWWKGAEYEERGGRREKIRRGPIMPAIVAALRNADGLLTGVHCTFIRPDGSGKADVDPPKLMLGVKKGSVIRIADGENGPAEEARARPGPLILAEGIETALTAAIAIPEARVWAAGDITNIGAAPVWHGCVSQIVVAIENDTAAEALAARDQALDALEEHGKPVGVLPSPVGKDLNDLAQEWA